MTKEQSQTSIEQPTKRPVIQNATNEDKPKQKATRTGGAPKKQADEQAIPSRRVRIRLIPIWLRVLIVLILLVGAILLGAIFGYSVIGDGEASDILNKETWQHIFDIMNGVE